MTGFKSKRLMAVGGGWVLAAPSVQVLDQAIVDGRQWYTISCLRDTSTWIRETFAEDEDTKWYQNIDAKWRINFNVFDVDEELFSLIALRWI